MRNLTPSNYTLSNTNVFGAVMQLGIFLTSVFFLNPAYWRLLNISGGGRLVTPELINPTATATDTTTATPTATDTDCPTVSHTAPLWAVG